ncbi:single-pass membrane and coiled-coil domain-containing protein 3 isoform X1 [Amia ocellicauda]|uniref:single-pass membrane and coiled-coil domain-containing protein 3 isoform X1 n=1 Tax=Amia ocellicauda TaxID=2972642 RepID=UPI0034642FE8
MSWSDFFYNNDARREKLARLGQEVLELMKNNFRATNMLSKALNTHCGCSFQQINLNEKHTVQQNCEVLLSAIGKIQEKVQEIDRQLKDALEPSCYQQLRSLQTPSTGDWRKVRNILAGVISIATAASCVALIGLVNSGLILSGVVLCIGGIATGALGCLVIGVLGLAIDLILSSFIGAMERDQLEKAIQEHEEVLRDFRPASHKYSETIMRVTVKIEMASESQH